MTNVRYVGGPHDGETDAATWNWANVLPGDVVICPCHRLRYQATRQEPTCTVVVWPPELARRDEQSLTVTT